MAMTRKVTSMSGILRQRGRDKFFTVAGIAVALGVVLSGLTLVVVPASAQAVTGADFNAGNIISDAVFYNEDAMQPSQIQEFLNRQVTSCAAGYTCLKDFTQNTMSHAADSYCRSPYTGVAGQSAANIIYAVAKACGINPQVILVLLQKEQALVTSRNPSQAAYDRATGFACPDTAPCAVDSLGFSNQVFKGARQYKIYRALPNSFNYRAGKVNNIQLNPNAGCGAPAVYIENQATAGLYDYTPYQPNAAALANLYGSGDGCSSYGNRNFWRIFSDWFGSTQGGGTLARTVGDPTIYLVTADHKYPVQTIATFLSLSALGPFQYTSQAYLDQFPTGIPAGNVFRDASTGFIYLIANGAKNKFPSCGMVSTWGLAGTTGCGNYIDLMPSQLLKLVTGQDVTQFPLSNSSGVIYSMSGGIKRAVHSFAQIDAIANGGSSAYTGFAQGTLDMFATGPDVIDAGSVVKSASSTTLYLLTNSATPTLVPIPSMGIYAEFGLSGYTVSSDAGIAASAIASTPLSIAVTCGAQQYIAGSGALWAIPNASGLPTTAIDAANCAALPKSSTAISGALFLRSTSGLMYNVAGGKKEFMSTMAQVNTLNGSNPLVWITESDSTLAGIPTRAAGLTPATLVKSASSPTVYFVNGTTGKVPLSSFAVSNEFGISGYSVAPDAPLDSYPTTGAPLSISVACGATRYIAGGGSLTAITAPDAGLPTTVLDTAACAPLAKSSATVTGAVFLRVPANGYIYYISGGTKRFVTTMDKVNALNGTNPLVLIPSNDTVLASIPTGPNV